MTSRAKNREVAFEILLGQNGFLYELSSVRDENELDAKTKINKSCIDIIKMTEPFFSQNVAETDELFDSPFLGV
jgi:hypothetical protein